MREKSFGFIFWLAFFISNCFFWSEAEEDGKSRQTFVIRYKDEDQTIPVTVVLDYKKQTEYVINMNPRTPAKSVTLYDFKQRTIAYKDLTNRECFLGRLTHETLSEESNALQDVKNPVEVKPKVRSLDPRAPALTPTEIRNIAGQKTAAFCRKMNTWLLMPEKAHSINKREVDDEFEEHTLQYHGHRSSQYSHYERQTKRRIRNRGQANHKRRSRTKEGVAEIENGRFSVSGQNNIQPHFTEPSTHIPFFYGGLNASKQNYSTDYGISESHFPFVQNESNNKDSPVQEFASEPATDQDHFRYLNSEDRYPPSNGISVYPKRHYLNSGATGDHRVSLIPNGEMLDSSKALPVPFSSQLARLKSDDSDTEIKSVTTNSPEFLNQLRTDYPNVHSSLLHLLPLYKPLGREFDFPESTGIENGSHNQTILDKRKSLESEAHDSLNHFGQPTNRFIHLTDTNDTSHNPDVSVNVLEVPRITKEFENIQNNRSYGKIPHLENSNRPSNSLYIPSSAPQVHSGNSTAIHSSRSHNAIRPQLGHIRRDDIPFNRNRNHLSGSETFFTTELPILTTREYFIPGRTTPDTSYVPSVHTAFQNLDDFNSFQIFPNYIENNAAPIPTEISSNTRTYHGDKGINSHAEVPQDLISTTYHPLVQEIENANSNQRSDIPSEDSNDKTLLNSSNESKAHQRSFPYDSHNKTGEDIFSHKIRYQNALRDFKPDEIVIDIENIPTHTPPPVTASFHQRVLTTIQPTIKVLPQGDIRSDTARRAEQTSVTSRRSFIPTTRFPRRRVNGNSRLPLQSNSIPFGHRNTENRNKLPSSHLNQLTGMRQFSVGHQTNRRQFYYPSHAIASPNVHVPSGMNQLHHVSHMNSLPPGVSVHPRHPQAPFADMVNSNRPPTMPILNDSQDHVVKPHRQRHHRKKDRLQHSCCRLRGNSGSLQSCCRNGGPCCSRSHRFVRPSNCCSSSKTNIVNSQIIPASQVQPHVRTANKILPSIRTEKTHRSEVDNKDRCQKEKMCRTLYESTQQVMVCRNAHVEGC